MGGFVWVFFGGFISRGFLSGGFCQRTGFRACDNLCFSSDSICETPASGKSIKLELTYILIDFEQGYLSNVPPKFEEQKGE